MENEEKQFTRGFNSGYFLSKYLPDLFSKVLRNIKPTSDYLQGLFAGKKEFEIENTKQELNEVKRIRSSTKSHDTDRELE